MEQTLRTENAAHGVRLFTIDRPSRKNALDLATYDALRGAIEDAGRDDTVRILVLTGAGGTFTSGNDLGDFQAPTHEGPSAAIQFLRTLMAATKPVVAAVEGHAVGIGSTLLLHCDLAYAGRSARFSLPFIKLALCPEAASSYLLPKTAGYKRAAELLMFGEPFSAEKACDIGLINEVTADGSALDTALARARVLASQPAQSLRLTKMLLKRGDHAAVIETMEFESQHFAQQRLSAEAQAAFAQFFAEKQADDRPLQ